MSGIFYGKRLKLFIFGESHGECVGAAIDGLPPGMALDMDAIRADMARRAPGRDGTTTQRRETDEPRIVSGVYGGKTTGAPLCVLFENSDTRPADYQTDLARPSHADWTGFVKYRGANDMRGGGHFSGRLTAPLVFAGAIARQWLSGIGITVGAHLMQIGEAMDRYFDDVSVDADTLSRLYNMDIPALDEAAEREMREEIEAARKDGDSVGGIIECAAIGIPAGLGASLFDSAESVISALLFAIPGCKGVEFGAGFALASMRGSDANDPIRNERGRVVTETNNSGGINGGITNGMPVILRAAFRPTASIALPQKTIDMRTGENAEITVMGRHDPCIAVRALAAVEAAVMVSLMDMALEGGLG